MVHEVVQTRRYSAHAAIAKVLNGGGAVLSVWVWLFRAPQFALLILAAIPAATIAFWIQSKRAYQIIDLRGDTRSSVAVALMFPSLVLALRAMIDFRLVHPLAVWFLALVGGIGAMLVLSRMEKSVEQPPAYIMLNDQTGLKNRVFAATVLFIGVAYFFGAVVQANAAFDGSEPRTYEVAVVKKTFAASARRGSHYLWLAPWGPQQEVVSEPVGPGFYNSFSVGQEVCVALHHGALNIPWYVISYCR
jgi:hypothetical protein